jgi:hypothetical protein
LLPFHSSIDRFHVQLLSDPGTKCNPVAAARQDDTTAPPLHDFELAADVQSQRQQAPFQTVPAEDADKSKSLTDRHLAEGQGFGQGLASNKNDSQYL